jgi:hypothetical protein
LMSLVAQGTGNIHIFILFESMKLSNYNKSKSALKGVTMEVNFIKHFTSTAGFSGLIINLITLFGMISPLFSLLAGLFIGLGALTYLFNFIAFLLLLVYRKKSKNHQFYRRNVLLIVSYLVVYPLIIDKTAEIL